jgi:hypothetical protein
MVNATDAELDGFIQNPPLGALKNNVVKSHHFKHIGFKLIITSDDESLVSKLLTTSTLDKYAKSTVGIRVISMLGSFLKNPWSLLMTPLYANSDILVDRFILYIYMT